MGNLMPHTGATVRVLSFASLVFWGLATPTGAYGQCVGQEDYPLSVWSFTLTSEGALVESGTFEFPESGPISFVARLTAGELAPDSPFEIELDTTPVETDGGLLYVLSGTFDADGCTATLTWDSPSGTSGDGSLMFVGEGQSPFVRGDCNADGAVTIADVIYTAYSLHVPGSPLPPCAAACDANDDGVRDISDAIFVWNALFLSGPVPSPYPGCGFDPTPATAAGLACAYYTGCP